MNHQDWKPVILKKSASQIKASNTVKGKTLSNKQPNSNNINSNLNKNKLDGDDVTAPKYISKAISKEIQQARVAKKISQQDLANALCVKKNIINDLESGKMLENKAFVRRVKNFLKIK